MRRDDSRSRRAPSGKGTLATNRKSTSQQKSLAELIEGSRRSQKDHQLTQEEDDSHVGGELDGSKGDSSRKPAQSISPALNLHKRFTEGKGGAAAGIT